MVVPEVDELVAGVHKAEELEVDTGLEGDSLEVHSLKTSQGWLEVNRELVRRKFRAHSLF